MDEEIRIPAVEYSAYENEPPVNEITIESPDDKKKGWAIAFLIARIIFFIAVVIFAILMLRIVPLSVKSYAQLNSRNLILTPGVKMQIDPRTLFQTGIEGIADDKVSAESYLLINEMQDGMSLLLVDGADFAEMTMEGTIIEANGQIKKIPPFLAPELQIIMMKYYDADKSKAEQMVKDLVYVDLRAEPIKGQRATAITFLVVSIAGFIAMLYLRKKQNVNN